MKAKSQKFLIWSPEMDCKEVKILLKEKVKEGETWLKPLLIKFREIENNNFTFCIKCKCTEKYVDYYPYQYFKDIPFMVFYLETVQLHIEDNIQLTFIYHLILISGRKWKNKYHLEHCIKEKIKNEGIEALRNFLEEQGNWIKDFEINVSKEELGKEMY